MTQPFQNLHGYFFIWGVICKSCLTIISHSITASPSRFPLNATYASNGTTPSTSRLPSSTDSSRTTTASLSLSPSNTTDAPNGTSQSTSWLALSTEPSRLLTASPSPHLMNMTYPLNGTNSTNSSQTMSMDPSLDDWGYCYGDFVDPVSCSCQMLLNSLASTTPYTSTWANSGGTSIQTSTDLAYVPLTDCCQSCYLLAYHVYLLYWPIEDKTSSINDVATTDAASVLYTTVSDGFTLYVCTPLHGTNLTLFQAHRQQCMWPTIV